MRGGIWVVSVLGAVWGAVALFGLGAPRGTLAASVLIAASILFICSRAPGRATPPEVDPRRASRSVAIWSVAEGVAILVAVNGLNNVGVPRLIAPAVAAIIGLHFLPLAVPLGLRVYYGLGAALIALGLGATLLPASWPLIVAATGSALLLWSTALLIAFNSPRATTSQA